MAASACRSTRSTFAPRVQRIKDAAAQGVFVFVPSSEEPIAFMRAFTDLGLDREHVTLVGGTEIIDEAVIAALGDKGAGRHQRAELFAGA